MDDDRRDQEVRELSHAADRPQDLADMAELMADDDGAARFRAAAARRRLRAMTVLDDE
jgi:hypothetical protein